MRESMETVSLFQKFACFFVFLISNRLGRILFVDTNTLGRRIKKYATTYRALEDIYTYSRTESRGKGLFERIFTDILFHFVNAKGVRNRLRVIERELQKVIISLHKKRVHIMSLGSGSARAILETISVKTNGVVCDVTMVDKSRAALMYSQKIAAALGLDGNLVWVKGLLEEFIKNGKDHPPDIVEMAGIMDYFSEDTAVEVLKQIHRLLLPGGALITCNICVNPERQFLEKVLGWYMVYRDAGQLARIMKQAGFQEFKIIQEPLSIHNIVIGHKANP